MKRGARTSTAIVAALAMLALGSRAKLPDRRRRGGRTMTLDQVRELARRVGFPDVDTAAAVAMAESRGYTDAENIHGPEPHALPERSFGLWQINTLAHPQFDERRLREPEYNARAAFVVSAGGTDWSHWSTFTHGDYRAWMPGGPNA